MAFFAVKTAQKLISKQSLTLILVFTASTCISACSWFQFPGVYRLQIQQGNIITQEMIDQLKPGMTKRQVNFVLGTPLIKDSLNQNRWDYYYSLRNAEGETDKKNLTVYFDDNEQLVRFEGDYPPPAPPANSAASS